MTLKAHSVGELVGGRYEIRAVIGKRPLGMMYRAFDREIEVEVALRVIAPELLPDEAARQAFAQRMGRARGLQHPNLMRFHGVAVDGDQVAVAVQWAPGPSLRERIGKTGMPATEARPILAQVAAGLQHAHTLGLVFGDVRPDTVVVYADGIKLSNIGIGLALPRRTFLEAMQGTPAHGYLAPELRAGRVAEPRADVFSLATMVVELLTGQATQPGQRISMAALAQLPPALGPALSRNLAEDPLLRQATVEALGREIDVILSTGAAPRPRRQTLPPVEAEVTDPDAKPHGFADALAQEGQTRQVTEDELKQIQGREVTRKVHEDELLPLRVQSSDIRPSDDFELEMEAEFEGEKEALDDTHDENERDTEPVVLLEPDAIKTERVEKIEPEKEAEPDEEDRETVRVEKLSPEELAGPEPLAKLDTAKPEPIAEPPARPERIARLALVSKPANGVVSSAPPPPPPRPREVEVPPTPAPPIPELPKIEVTELPVERGPRFPSPPRGTPRMPTPPGGTPRAPTPARGVPRAPTPPRGVPSVLKPRHSPTQEVVPLTLPPPKRSRRGVVYGILVIVAFAAVLAAVVLGIADHMREIRLARERATKQRLADELNARAEAMRRASTAPARTAPQSPTQTPTAPTSPSLPPSTPPIQPVAVPFANRCPLGANLVDDRFCVDLYEYPGGKTIPRTEVSFEEAGRLCASRGERLCTEHEWEQACRGKSGASYPYGQSFDPTRCNTRGSGGEIAAAGTFAGCRSASGAYDMSGNVSEWVTSIHGAAQKGGSVLSTNPQVRCSNVVRSQPGEGSLYVGFRCCADPK